LADLYNKAYQEQLAGLSVGVDEKQLQQQKQREQYLADRGISLDSQAYRNEQASLAEMQAQEDAQLRSQASQFAQQRADSEFNRSLQSSALEMDRARLEQDLKYRGLEALTPLATAQAQMGENRWLANFNAKTQERLQGMQLDQADKQFLASLNQSDRQFFETMAENKALRLQNNDLANKEIKIELGKLKLQKKDIALKQKQTYESIRSSKAMTQLQKEQLAELVRSNKVQEALDTIKVQIAKAGTVKEKEDLKALQDRIVAVGDAQIEVELNRREQGLDPVPVGGVSYGFGG